MKKGIVIGAIVVVAALGALLYLSFGSSVTYYVTASELLAEGSDRYDTNVRVTGNVGNGSIDWNPHDLLLRFTLEEGGASLPIVYEGLKPDAFIAGAEVLAEGKYNSDGIFRASNLMMKCPSKYSSEE